MEGSAAAVALDVHLEDGGVMDQAIDRGERHGGIGEDPPPFAEWLVGGDQRRAALVPRADEFEQDRCLGLVFSDVGEVVEDEQMIFVEPGKYRLEPDVAPRDLH